MRVARRDRGTACAGGLRGCVRRRAEEACGEPCVECRRGRAFGDHVDHEGGPLAGRLVASPLDEDSGPRARVVRRAFDPAMVAAQLRTGASPAVAAGRSSNGKPRPRPIPPAFHALRRQIEQRVRPRAPSDPWASLAPRSREAISGGNRCVPCPSTPTPASDFRTPCPACRSRSPQGRRARHPSARSRPAQTRRRQRRARCRQGGPHRGFRHFQGGAPSRQGRERTAPQAAPAPNSPQRQLGVGSASASSS